MTTQCRDTVYAIKFRSLEAKSKKWFFVGSSGVATSLWIHAVVYTDETRVRLLASEMSKDPKNAHIEFKVVSR